MNSSPESAPETLRRLFPELADGDFEPLLPTPFVIGRLLEEGDSADLRWLCRRISEDRLAGWMSERAERQLSRRSRAFWSLVLSAPEPRSPRQSRREPRDNPLWPF